MACSESIQLFNCQKPTLVRSGRTPSPILPFPHAPSNFHFTSLMSSSWGFNPKVSFASSSVLLSPMSIKICKLDNHQEAGGGRNPKSGCSRCRLKSSDHIHKHRPSLSIHNLASSIFPLLMLIHPSCLQSHIITSPQSMLLMPLYESNTGPTDPQRFCESKWRKQPKYESRDAAKRFIAYRLELHIRARHSTC